MTVRHALEADNRAVVLLTEREASAILAYLQESLPPVGLVTGDSDLARGYRVLSRQVAYLESPVHGSGRPRVA